MPEVRGRRRDSPRKDEPPSKRIRGSDSSRSPGTSSHRNGNSSSPRYSNSRRGEESSSSSSTSRYSSRNRGDDPSRTRRDSERSSRNRRRHVVHDNNLIYIDHLNMIELDAFFCCLCEHHNSKPTSLKERFAATV